MEWPSVPFSETVRKTSVGRENQILASEMKAVGRFPVIDQGQSFIAGYSDDESRLITRDLPLVVFGDHTRVVKFVDFPFILGADGTKVLKPLEDLFDARFFAFALQSLNLPSRGYNRHFTLLKERSLLRPELGEQRKITAVLELVKRAIEQQNEVIALTTELKKTLTNNLFTQGLGGAAKKQSEIGLIPRSWEVTTVGSLVDIAHGYAFASRCFTNDGRVVLTPGNFKLGGGLYWGIRTKYTIEECSEEYYLTPGDLVMVMTDLTPSAKLLGTPAVIPSGQLILHNQRIGKVVLKTDATTKNFLYWVFLTDTFRKHMVLTATGSTVRHSSPSRIKDFKFALPPKGEQNEIASTLESIDGRISVLERKRDALRSLFCTLLHQLLTGKIRVNDLNISLDV